MPCPVYKNTDDCEKSCSGCRIRKAYEECAACKWTEYNCVFCYAHATNPAEEICIRCAEASGGCDNAMIEHDGRCPFEEELSIAEEE